MYLRSAQDFLQSSINRKDLLLLSHNEELTTCIWNYCIKNITEKHICVATCTSIMEKIARMLICLTRN